MNHEMKLRKIPFDKILDGTKKIESRLYDEKRRLIKVGDNIIFSLENEQGECIEKVTKKVQAIFLYENFETMMNDLPCAWFGWEKPELAIAEINQFYSQEDQVKNGVIGFRIV